MFYLLDDNRLIDSKIEDVYVNDFQNSLWLHNNGKYKGDVIGKIKKQSENIYDLIDWEEDLVKSRMNNIIWQCYVLNQISDISEQIKYKTIIAIYKPNSNGGYIKVWEKKDNEVK